MGLKAFAVLEKEENTGGIIFAERDINARKAGANEYADGEITGVTCRRAPWADQYADTGKVPVRVQVEAGWHYECSGCAVRIDEYLYDRYEPEGEQENEKMALTYNGWTPADIVEDGQMVYCQEACRAAYKRERAAIEAQELRHRNRLEHFLRRRFPDIALINRDTFRGRVHTYCRRGIDGKIRLDQANIPFDYPGMKHGPGDLHFERSRYRHDRRRLTYNCAGGDVDTFVAWLQTHGVRQRPGTGRK